MNCSECIYKKYCKLQHQSQKCTMMFVQAPKETELLEILQTAATYKIVSVIDERTHELCMNDNGKVISMFAVIDALPHVDLGDPEFRCRCVLEALTWEEDKKVTEFYKKHHLLK